MEKFKKVLKVVIITLITIGLIGAVISYCIIPDKTKLFFDGIREFINQPLPIAVGSTITIGGVVWFIISKIGFGSGELKKIRENVEGFKVTCNDYKSQAHEYYELAKVEKSEIKTILTNYDSKIENLENELVKVCETIPNAKVQALAQEIIATHSALKVELNDKLDNIDEYIEETTTKFDYESAYNELLDRLTKLEKDYGEREETING